MNGLKSLLGEPLALDARYLPTLMRSIEAELTRQSNRTVDTEDEDQDDPSQVSISLRCGSSGEVFAGEDTDGVDPGSIIAVVPMTSVFTRHGGWWGPGSKSIGETIGRLDRDPAVGMIVLDVDSPGGSVFGTPELSDTIYGVRRGERTEIVAVADPLMASAATWTASAASKVFAIPSSEVGSIGVISAYTDWSKFLEEKGIKVDVVRNPSLKARFSGVEPLSDEMRSTMESRNQKWYGRFTGAMARNRGVDSDAVESKFGGGETMDAAEAVKAGLIDGISSVDEVVQDYVSRRQRSRSGRRSAWAAAGAAIDLASVE